MLQEDLSVYTSMWGVPVSYAGAPIGALGIPDVADEKMAISDKFPGVLGTTSVVEIETTAAAEALRAGDAITVNGVAHKVAWPAKFGDGKFMRVYLQDADA